MGGGGGRLVSGSLVHSTDLGRPPEEVVVVRGQEGMSEMPLMTWKQMVYCLAGAGWTLIPC